jgi:photosystem II stability/assembly factor-like uncharacterized protein
MIEAPAVVFTSGPAMKSVVTSAIVALSVMLAASAAVAQTWMPAIPYRAVYSMAVNPLNTKSIFAGNIARTVFRSTDGGITWEELAVGSTDGSSKISCLYIHPVDTNLVFAGGNEFNGIDRSTDGGVTWKSVLTDPQGFRAEFHGESIIAHPTAADTMYAIRNSPGTLYRSTDRGATWDSLSSPGPASGGDRYFRSITVAPDSTNIVLVGGYTTFVHRSTDGGRTFTKDPVATRTGTVGAFRWSTLTAGTVYATVQFNVSRASGTPGGIWRSTDWGATWEVMAHADVSLIPLEVYAHEAKGGADVMYTGGNTDYRATQAFRGDSLVFRTIDGGMTWRDISDVPWTENESGEVTGNVTAIKRVKQDQGDVVLLASESGMFVSSVAASVATTPPTPTMDLVVRRSLNDMVELQWKSLDGPVTIDLYTADGQRVLTQPTVMVNGSASLRLPSLVPGVYMLAAQHGSRRACTRFLRYE